MAFEVFTLDKCRRLVFWVLRVMWTVARKSPVVDSNLIADRIYRRIFLKLDPFSWDLLYFRVSLGKSNGAAVFAYRWAGDREKVLGTSYVIPPGGVPRLRGLLAQADAGPIQ